MPAGSDTAGRVRPQPLRPQQPVVPMPVPVPVPVPEPMPMPGASTTDLPRLDPAARRSGRQLTWADHTGAGRRPLSDSSYSDRTIRLLTVAPLAVLLAGVAVQLVMTPVYNRGARSTLLSLALMAGYMPMVGYQTWSAAHLRRPRAGRWMLAATAVIIAAGLVLIGNEWQMTMAHLLVSVLIVLPRRWAIVGGCLVLATVAPVDLLVDPAPNPLWTMLVVGQRAGAVLVPTWFVSTLRQLRATRETLADQAVLRERMRIDRELTGTVGDSLTAIAERGAAAAVLARTDPELARRELAALVDGSRQALAGARRLIRSYQRVTLRAELETAVTLLSAAGVSARLALPDHGLAEHAEPELRAALRSAVDRLLREQTTCGYVITVEMSTGAPRLTVSVDGAVR